MTSRCQAADAGRYEAAIGKSTELRNDQLARGRALAAADRIAQLYLLLNEPGKNRSCLRHVVDRQDEPSLQASQARGDRLELLAAEKRAAVIAFRAPVWRVEVKQRLRPVVPVDEGQPIKLLDDDAGKPLMQGDKQRLQPCEVEGSGLL
ncbi:hypothetical protein [Nitratireductor alexandrii]|uniref:hypothetical protein n=1 Tax=Nitratireductor alexandrii TaxID=2448161 RepID=UPI0013DF7057